MDSEMLDRAGDMQAIWKQNVPLLIQLNKLDIEVGICGGSVWRVVVSDSREPQFKSQHRQNFICQLYFKIKKKRPEMADL